MGSKGTPENRRLNETATIREVLFIVDAAIGAHNRNRHIPIWRRLWRRWKKQRTQIDIDAVLEMAAAAARKARTQQPGFDAAGKPSSLLS